MKLQGLPAYQGKRELISGNHNVYDIVKEVCNAHEHFEGDYDSIADRFWRGNPVDTARALFDFCRNTMRYRAEPAGYQTTRSPAAIIETSRSMGVDCKHYAGFIGGVLSALRRSGHNIDWWYRFVSYDVNSRVPSHVFVVMRYKGRDIFVDPVLNEFDKRFPNYFYKLDKKTDMLERISGVGVVRPELVSDPVFTVPGREGLPRVTKTPVVIDPLERKSNVVLWIGAAIAIYFLVKSSRRG